MPFRIPLIPTLLFLLSSDSSVLAQAKEELHLNTGEYVFEMKLADKDWSRFPAHVQSYGEYFKLSVQTVLGSAMKTEGIIKDRNVKFGMTEPEHGEILTMHFLGKALN